MTGFGTGETLEICLTVSLAGGRVLREGDAEILFWAPGKSLADPPDHVAPAEWDSPARAFVAWADTVGWAPGRWTVRGRVAASTERGPAKGQSDPFPLLLRAAA